jgi:hypothetical protein
MGAATEYRKIAKNLKIPIDKLFERCYHIHKLAESNLTVESKIIRHDKAEDYKGRRRRCRQLNSLLNNTTQTTRTERYKPQNRKPHQSLQPFLPAIGSNRSPASRQLDSRMNYLFFASGGRFEATRPHPVYIGAD